METKVDLLEGGKAKAVGIGPVIAGRSGAKPVYYVDIAYADGSTERVTWDKRGEGADRAVKNEAYRQRIMLANQLRPNVVLTHDQYSFDGLVAILSRRPHPGSRRPRLAA